MEAREDKDRFGEDGEALFDPGSSISTEKDVLYLLQVIVFFQVSEDLIPEILRILIEASKVMGVFEFGSFCVWGFLSLMDIDQFGQKCFPGPLSSPSLSETPLFLKGYMVFIGFDEEVGTDLLDLFFSFSLG